MKIMMLYYFHFNIGLFYDLQIIPFDIIYLYYISTVFQKIYFKIEMENWNGKFRFRYLLTFKLALKCV